MLKLAVDHPEWILTVVSSLVLACLAVLEGTYSVLSGKPLYDRRDTACNLAMFAGSFIVNLFWVRTQTQGGHRRPKHERPARWREMQRAEGERAHVGVVADRRIILNLVSPERREDRQTRRRQEPAQKPRANPT